MSFTKLGLTPELLRTITARGYKIATPIQAKSIPPILKGCDVMAGAQTGTGKTAAFSLPILQLFNATPRKGRNPRALILTPTRELAAQVLDFIKEYGKGMSLRSTAIFGGVNIRPQISALKNGIDILIATPGRLLDHIGQKTLRLSDIEILVLDEADRMLDMGFAIDLKKILKLVPSKRQNLLFSATYSSEIKSFADSILKNPVLIEVSTRNTTADTVKQVVHPVAQDQKRVLLSKLIREGNWEQTLVFTRTKHGANHLVKSLLKDNITATAIHGNKSQAARTRALAEFKKGKLRVLVATDIAARGLDINLLPHVVNFELPDTPENYIHRIGRTGRAGANGKAISLVCPEDNYELHAINKLLKRKLPIERIEGFDAKLLLTAGRPKPQGQRGNFSRGNKNNSNKRVHKGQRPRTGNPKSKTASPVKKSWNNFKSKKAPKG
jgi:ATP-dependent RNA helicase RhlE